MTIPQPLPHIAALPSYVPGARGDADAAPPIKVSSNENPLPPLPSVQDAIAQAGAAAHRYPDMFAGELTSTVAEAYGVEPASVVVGGGSVAVLAHVLQAYAGPESEVLYAWRSFEAYPILATVTGATPVTVPVDAAGRHDLDAMAAAITERTAVVMVCSPNNPTGPAVTADEFAAFVDAVPERVLIVLDEAYAEFVRADDAVDGTRWIGAPAWAAHPNVVVLRTMSKAYGLAGLRVGFAFGHPDVLTPVRACVTPFSVSATAQLAGVASLAARDELLQRVEAIVAERGRVLAALAADGWTVPDAQGNFFWLAAGERTTDLVAHLAAQEPTILVRPFAGEGARISIGSAEENDAVLAALASLNWRV